MELGISSKKKITRILALEVKEGTDGFTNK